MILALGIMALHSAHCCSILFFNFDTAEEMKFSSLAVSSVVLLCFLKTLGFELQQGPSVQALLHSL